MRVTVANEKTKTVKVIDHPLEDFFDIEKGTTEVTVYERGGDSIEGELVQAEEFDDKDREIEEQFEEVYNVAMEGYDLLADEMLKVEGKYKARVGEVSVQHLNTALNAASLKARLKEHKDKLEAKTKTPANVTNNNTLIVDDRSALLRQLKEIDPKEENNE